MKAEQDHRLSLRLTPKQKFSIELLSRATGKSISRLARDAIETLMAEYEVEQQMQDIE